MKLLTAVKTLITLRVFYAMNGVIYFLKRLWLVGPHIPDSLFGRIRVKKALTAIVVLWYIAYKMTTPFLYVSLCIALPLSLIIDEYAHLSLAQDGFNLGLWMFFFLNYVSGSLVNSRIFRVTTEKYIAIKQLKLDPQVYVQADLLLYLLTLLITNIPVFLVVIVLFGLPFYYFVLLLITFLSFRLSVDGVFLYLYQKKRWLIRSSYIGLKGLLSVFIVFIILTAYLPPVFGIALSIDRFLFHPISGAVLFALGLISFYYLFFGYKEYRTAYLYSVRYEFLDAVVAKEMVQSGFRDVELKEKDYMTSQGLDHLKGYRYINAIFFKRHRRMLLRSVFFHSGVVILLGMIGLIAYFFRPQAISPISQELYRYVGTFVFALYFVSIGQKATRAMFYNADISLLRYPFYRKPTAVIEHFWIRLRVIGRYNLIIAGTMLLMVWLFQFVTDGPLFSYEMIGLYLVMIIGSLFFAVHQLFLYYVFQPFTTDLKIKNPFYIVIESSISVLAFTLLQVKASGFGLVGIILAFTTLYILVALILVYRLAPKYFRVK